MMSKVDLERIDRGLQFICSSDKPFGGKVVLLSGDYRQILPVEKNPVDSVNTCIKSSDLWYHLNLEKYFCFEERQNHNTITPHDQ